MFEKNYQESAKKDRKLGDEWADWNGTNLEGNNEIDENKGTFLILSFVFLLISYICIGLLWYMIRPRLMEFGPVALSGAWIILILSLSVPTILFALEIYSIITQRRSPLPYGLSERFLLFFLPKAIWIGKRFGFSKDRVGNSFIKANNSLTLSHDSKIRSDRPLVLLPRCLKKGIRKEILEIIDDHPCEIKTVGGGEEARKVIIDYKPNFIIALACERDLMSGIREVAPHIPVIGIPNKRPEGPCKNTHIDINDFQKAFLYVKEKSSHLDSTTPFIPSDQKEG